MSTLAFTRNIDSKCTQNVLDGKFHFKFSDLLTNCLKLEVRQNDRYSFLNILSLRKALKGYGQVNQYNVDVNGCKQFTTMFVGGTDYAINVYTKKLTTLFFVLFSYRLELFWSLQLCMTKFIQ